MRISSIFIGLIVLVFLAAACGGLSESEKRYDSGVDLQEQGALDEAIRLGPKLALAYANRAVASNFLGNEAAARQDIDRAVELGFDRDLLEAAIAEIIDQR